MTPAHVHMKSIPPGVEGGMKQKFITKFSLLIGVQITFSSDLFSRIMSYSLVVESFIPSAVYAASSLQHSSNPLFFTPTFFAICTDDVWTVHTCRTSHVPDVCFSNMNIIPTSSYVLCCSTPLSVG